MKLIIRGSKKYVSWLKKHLSKEHPKTKGRMKLKK